MVDFPEKLGRETSFFVYLALVMFAIYQNHIRSHKVPFLKDSTPEITQSAIS